MGKMSTWWIWSLVYFHSFEALMMLLKYNFFRASFYTLPKTLIAFRTMQLRFFKVKNCLINNAHSYSLCETLATIRRMLCVVTRYLLPSSVHPYKDFRCCTVHTMQIMQYANCTLGQLQNTFKCQQDFSTYH